MSNTLGITSHEYLVFQLQEFQSSLNTEEGLPKPIMVMIIKGMSEDNPNYGKTISCAIDYFCTFDLDALYITKDIDNAAGRNTQMVLNRIIPVAKDLAKVILPYDHFGQHYDGNNDTIDEDLEKLNYEKGIFVLYYSYLYVFLVICSVCQPSHYQFSFFSWKCPF